MNNGNFKIEQGSLIISYTNFDNCVTIRYNGLITIYNNVVWYEIERYKSTITISLYDENKLYIAGIFNISKGTLKLKGGITL